jgi:putative membrane protein
MSEEPRPVYTRNQLAVQRTLLAVQRNLLAVERTFLAYLRTALAFSGVGLTLVEVFSEEKLLLVIGWIFIPLGLLLVFWGGWRSLKARRLSKRLCEERPRRARLMLGIQYPPADQSGAGQGGAGQATVDEPPKSESKEAPHG